MDVNSTLSQRFDAAMSAFPCIAILRGLEPSNAAEVGAILFKAGFRVIEVPLNSPEPLKSIEILSREFGNEAIIGAGTVLTVKDVDAVRDAGGQIIVSPNMNTDVIKRTKALGLLSAPGVQTVSEAFAAIDAGADSLKFFPGEAISPAILKAMKAVLPPQVPCLVVGGVTADKMQDYINVGASGFGLGSAVFKAGDSASTVRAKTVAFTRAVEKIHAR